MRLLREGRGHGVGDQGGRGLLGDLGEGEGGVARSVLDPRLGGGKRLVLEGVDGGREGAAGGGEGRLRGGLVAAAGTETIGRAARPIASVLRV